MVSKFKFSIHNKIKSLLLRYLLNSTKIQSQKFYKIVTITKYKKFQRFNKINVQFLKISISWIVEKKKRCFIHSKQIMKNEAKTKTSSV